MSFDIFENYATDPKLELEGAWFHLGKAGNGKDARVLVARSNNDNYIEALQAQMKRHQAAMDAGGKGAEILAEKIIVEVMANTLLLGWENISFKKKEVEYSVEMAKTLLAVRDFRAKIDGFSKTFDAFRAKDEEEQKND